MIMNNLPFYLKYLSTYLTLTDKQLEFIRTKLAILSGLLFLTVVIFPVKLTDYWEDANIFQQTGYLLFLVGIISIFGIIIFKVERLELLENSDEDVILKFQKLVKNKVAVNYLENHVLPYRSVYVFDQIIISYLVDEEKRIGIKSKSQI